MGKPITMQQIADKAGVSKMTVSRALRDHPKQSDATKKRIKEIAESMGYQIHPYVSALMGQRANKSGTSDIVKIAIFHFTSDDQTRRHNYFTGAEERARQLGYGVELFRYAPEKTKEERLRQILYSRGIRGIIVMPSIRGLDRLQFDFEGFATIAMGHSIVEPALPRVGSDPQASVFTALHQIREKGFKRIGLVNTKYVNHLSRFLYSGGFHAYQKHYGRALHFSELELATHDERIEAAPLEKWIRKDRPEVILSSSFDIDIHRLLTKEIGIKVPEELGYIHLLQHSNPEVHHIDPHEQAIGSKAADLVISAIKHNDFSPSSFPYSVGISPEWVPRSSLKVRGDR